jgi:hypothetical protein
MMIFDVSQDGRLLDALEAKLQTFFGAAAIIKCQFHFPTLPDIEVRAIYYDADDL